MLFCKGNALSIDITDQIMSLQKWTAMKKFFLYYWFLGLIKTCHCENVTIVSIHIGANPLYGYYVAMPVYEVAAKHIRIKHPGSLANLSHIPIYLPGHDLCQPGGDRAADFFAQFYYNQRPKNLRNESFVAFFSPECTEQVLQLADLAREFDLPLFTSVAGDEKLTSRERYPTTSALAPLARTDSMAGIAAFLARYSWRRISLICDMLTQYPGLNFYPGQCGEIRQLFAAQKYIWDYKPFDSGKGQPPFREYLFDLKNRKRVIMILTAPQFVREFMIEADKLGLTTTGEYFGGNNDLAWIQVFLCLQPTKRPGVRPMTWISETDTPENNARAFNAYRSLIVLTGISPDWASIKNLTNEFLATSIALNNHSYAPDDQENELQICIYESTMMFGQVFNDHYPELLNMPTNWFISQFFSRTFDFAGRKISTNVVGAKINHVLIMRLNPYAKVMETAMMFNTETNTFYNIKAILWYWVNRNSAPPDMPLCGFLNNECVHVRPAGETVAICTLSGLIVLITAFLYTRYRASKSQGQPLWWLLDMTMDTKTESCLSEFDTLARKVTGFRCRAENKYVYAYELKSSNGSVFTADNLGQKEKLTKTFRSLRYLIHPNLALFYGVALGWETMYVLSEYTERQSLRFFLDQEELAFDKEFQYSLCWDLIEGVEYLHGTYGPHGNISSFVCVIDSKFMLKLSHTSYIQIGEQAQAKRDEVDPQAFQNVEFIWKPPEVVAVRQNLLEARKRSLAKETDMYAVGIIFYEILAGLLSAEAAINPLHFPEVNPIKTQSGFETDLTANVIPAFLNDLFQSCLGAKKARPTARTFRHKLQAIKPKPKYLVEHVLLGLEKQTSNLEDVVAQRTAQLEKEKKIADKLLLEILPNEAIKKMRNGETVQPELFESVTVMFSDIPVFQQISSLCPSLEIVAFLNEIYSRFDGVILEFDAYKVETVNDYYIVASGLPNRNGDRHAKHICTLAILLQKEAENMKNPTKKTQVLLRVGVNSGPIIGGIVGTRMPRYCLFGDTMNTASRMNTYGEGGKIHIAESTKKLIEECVEFQVKQRARITVKGKGEMFTYWLRALR